MYTKAASTKEVRLLAGGGRAACGFLAVAALAAYFIGMGAAQSTVTRHVLRVCQDQGGLTCIIHVYWFMGEIDIAGFKIAQKKGEEKLAAHGARPGPPRARAGAREIIATQVSTTLYYA
eukprot:scaffold35020_cov61-Phaeocystis_antarctica.AAC.6